MTVAALERRATRPLRLAFVDTLRFRDFLVLCAVHAAATPIIVRWSWLAGAYAAAVAAGALLLCWRRPALVPAALCYVITAELIWRIGAAPVPWELGKYICCALFLIALSAGPGRNRGPMAIGALMFALLLPSSALTLADLGVSNHLRTTLAMALSGPLTLAIGAATVTSWRAADVRLHRVLLYAAPPIVGLATLAVVRIQGAGQLLFTDESNFQTSAGYGPNQVSSVLGAGALILALLATLPMPPMRRNVLYAMSTWFLAQAVLTFSRGGVLTAAAAVVVLTLHVSVRLKRSVPYVAVFATFALVAVFVIAPRMNAFTGGALAQRFASVQLSARDVLVRHEFSLFRENPLLGVGPGMATELRMRDPSALRATSHSEFSRALAEHGILGAAYLLLLAGLAAYSYWRAHGLLARGWIAAFATWGFLTIAETSMRLAVAPVLLCFCLIDFSRDRSAPGTPARSAAPRAT